MQKTRINPNIYQELLESAPNAGAKGQAQYYTPGDWATVLGLPLPKYRPCIVDLTAGNGQFMAGVAYRGSDTCGCDIDPAAVANAGPNAVAADITRFHPLLGEVKFEADLFVLNPPWDMHWHRDRLTALADSSCRAVADAYAAHDGRTGKDTIDSTIVTICLALHYGSVYGEGVCVANESSLQRLIFAPGAPHSALKNHIWAHMVVDGNFCQPAAKGGDEVSFKTGVIWFARAPQSGSPVHLACPDMAAAKVACQQLQRDRIKLRRGAEVNEDYASTPETRTLWQAAADEWALRTATNKKPMWNLYLNMDGTIQTNLSLFDEHSGRIPKGEVVRLFALNGKQPMSLVIQKNERKELERAAFGDTWRVAPAVQQAVRLALKEYDAVRAPIRPLNKIQRLGFLDEYDNIQCAIALPRFSAGKSYPLRTQTVQVRRAGEKMNVSGELDAVEWSGSELCIYITDEEGVERTFMEGKLRDKNVKLSMPDTDDTDEANRVKIDYTLLQLTEHFTIPEVPSVAELHPEQYQRNVALLHEIEEIIAS